MITAKKLLYKFKKDMEMSDDKFIKFCRRYAYGKDVTSLVWVLKRRYRDVPANLKRDLKREFTELTLCFENERCNKNSDTT